MALYKEISIFTSSFQKHNADGEYSLEEMNKDNHIVREIFDKLKEEEKQMVDVTNYDKMIKQERLRKLIQNIHSD